MFVIRCPASISCLYGYDRSNEGLFKLISSEPHERPKTLSCCELSRPQGLKRENFLHCVYQLSVELVAVLEYQVGLDHLSDFVRSSLDCGD